MESPESPESPRVILLISNDDETVECDRQTLFELAPTLDSACTSFKVAGVDGQMLRLFVTLLNLYREHDCKQQQLPTTREQFVVPEPMWDFIELLPHGALIYVLNAARQLKTCSFYDFVSNIGFLSSIKHPHRNAMNRNRTTSKAKRCLVCYKDVNDPPVCWSGKYATRFFDEDDQVFRWPATKTKDDAKTNKVTKINEATKQLRVSCASDGWGAELLTKAMREAQRIEELENGLVGVNLES